MSRQWSHATGFQLDKNIENIFLIFNEPGHLSYTSYLKNCYFNNYLFEKYCF